MFTYQRSLGRLLHLSRKFKYSNIQIFKNSKKYVDKTNAKVKNAFSCESIHKHIDKDLDL